MPPPPTLETARLILRPLVEDDLDALTALHAEESFWWFPMGRAMTAAETRAFMDRVVPVVHRQLSLKSERT